MDKRYLDLNEMYKMLEGKTQNRTREMSDVMVPACINTEFCVAPPKDRNDGILTMAYVDMQPIENVYALSDAFCRGTLFPNLDKPFYGGKIR